MELPAGQGESSARPSGYVAAVGLLCAIFIFKPRIFEQLRYIIAIYLIFGLLVDHFFTKYALGVIASLSAVKIVSWVGETIESVKAWQRGHLIVIILQQVIILY